MNGQPHQSQPVFAVGKSLEEATGAMILVHGRGNNARNFSSMARDFPHPGLVYLLPQAAGNTWYPYGFMEPMHMNEPGISSGIAVLKYLVDQVIETGIPSERILMGGFSQGACLVLEFAARHPARYGGIFGLSGGLIGPEGTPRDYPGSFEGTPVFLGCSDIDFHIPKARVQLTNEVLDRMGATVTERLYPGMGHYVNDDEIDFVRSMVASTLP